MCGCGCACVCVHVCVCICVCMCMCGEKVMGQKEKRDFYFFWPWLQNGRHSKTSPIIIIIEHINIQKKKVKQLLHFFVCLQNGHASPVHVSIHVCKKKTKKNTTKTPPPKTTQFLF